MTRHDPALSRASKLITKSVQVDDEDVDPAAEAVDKFTATVTKKLSRLEEKIASVADEAKAANDRADELETKLQRPGARGGSDEPTVEQKAFGSFLRKGVEHLPEIERKTLRIAVDTAGGFITAPDEFATEIVKNIVEFSPVRQVARVTGIGTAGVRLPKRTGRLTGYWVDETETRTSTEPTYGQILIQAMEMACYVPISNSLIEDAAVDLAAELARDFAEEFGRLEGAAFVKGTGVKQPTGFMVDPDVGYVASGGASSFASSNPGDALISLYHSIPTVYAQKGTWGMNRSTMAAVRQFKDGQGRYLWQDGLQAGLPPTLLGRPVVEMPDLDNVGANTFPIVWGDLSQYRIVDRIAINVMRDPYSQATSGITVFHARRRVGGGLLKAEAIKKLKIATS